MSWNREKLLLVALGVSLLAGGGLWPSSAWAQSPGHSASDSSPEDGVVVVVSPENQLTELSRQRLIDIYLGRNRHFPNGQRAQPLEQRPDSQAREIFYEQYLGRSASELKAYWSRLVFTGRGRPPPDVGNGQAIKEKIAQNPQAIGYIQTSLVDDSVRVVRVR